MASNDDDINAWLNQLKDTTIAQWREAYGTTTGQEQQPDAPGSDDATDSTNLNLSNLKPICVLLGPNGAGMTNEAARLMAARQNHLNDDDTISYAAEQHGYPSLAKPWAVVGRQVAGASADAPDPQNAPETDPSYSDEEAAQDLARESRRGQPAPTAPLTDQFDLSDKGNFKDYLQAVQKRAAQGLPLDSQDIATSKALLFHYYGYAMGEQRGTAQQLRANLNAEMSPALGRALDAFGKSSADEQRNRYDFYSNLQAISNPDGSLGRGRTINVTRDGRTITLRWDPAFSNLAATGPLKVSEDEALRKTDFDVYKSVVDAAFKTDGVQSLNINGAWRPHPEDFLAIVGHPEPHANVKSAHITSRALDVNRVNDVNIYNQGYVDHRPAVEEPDIVKRLTANLLGQPGARQIFQPWHLWNDVATDDAVNNPDVLNIKDPRSLPFDNAILHQNHLHFGLN